MKHVYFDEGGNTGAALLDSMQPIFTLASVDYSEAECLELLKIIQSDQGGEAKFTSLRKSERGRQKIINFLLSPIHSEARVKTIVMHKHYMVVTKVVDIILETFAYSKGVDLYKNGTNIALSNMLYAVIPALCGNDAFQKFLNSFVDLIRFGGVDRQNAFFSSVRNLKSLIGNEKFNTLDMLLAAEDEIDEILEGVDYLHLDPAVPAFFYLCSKWGDQIGCRFSVVHDNSKAIAANHGFFTELMNPKLNEAVIGYDRRRFSFPLKANEIVFGDSKIIGALQVADIFASATAFFAGMVDSGEKSIFSEQLKDAGIEKYMVLNIWPSHDVTPDSLGTADHSGVNSVDYMVHALMSVRD